MVIRWVRKTNSFRHDVKHIRDELLKKKIKKQIQKIVHNPEVGKPLGNILKGERSVYIKPFRLTYAIDGETLVLLKFRHRKDAYKKAS